MLYLKGIWEAVYQFTLRDCSKEERGRVRLLKTKKPHPLLLLQPAPFRTLSPLPCLAAGSDPTIQDLATQWR